MNFSDERDLHRVGADAGLAWAASASAECAFVMWISPLTNTQWDPSESFQVLAETRRIRS